MSESRRKIARIQPVIMVRKAKVDQESAMLSRIRLEKRAAVADMKESQRIYMEGIERLNNERTSMSREMLAPLESSLDFIKNRWYSLYRRVQDIEAREKAQSVQLDMAQRELMAVEKLSENYTEEFKIEMRRGEQKNLDEIALRRFSGR